MRTLGTLANDEDEETFRTESYPAQRTFHGLSLYESNEPSRQAPQHKQNDPTVSDSQSAWANQYGDADDVAQAATALCDMQNRSIHGGTSSNPHRLLHENQHQGSHYNGHNSPTEKDYDSDTPLIEAPRRGRIRHSTPFPNIARNLDQKPKEDYDSNIPLIEARGRGQIRQATPFPDIARGQDQRPSFTQNHFPAEEDYDSDAMVVANPSGRRHASQRPLGPRSGMVLESEAARESENTQTAIEAISVDKEHNDGTDPTVQDLTIKTTANTSPYPAIRTNGHSLVDRQANELYVFQHGASLLRTIGRNLSRVESISKSHPNLSQALKKVAENVILARGGFKFAPHLNEKLAFDDEDPPKEVETAAGRMRATKAAFSSVIGDQEDWNWGFDTWKGKEVKVSKPKPSLRPKSNREKTEAQKEVIDLTKDSSSTFGDSDIKPPLGKWKAVNDYVDGAHVPLVDDVTGRDIFFSGDGMDMDNGRLKIKKDQIACSNQDRLRIQGEGSSNPNLLKFPAGSCLRSSCKKIHKRWSTVGKLSLPGCAQCCEVCGYVVDGPASKVRAHVKSSHVGPDFNPAAMPEDRILYISVGGGSTKANHPKNVREWMNKTGKPASEYALPKDHPRYLDWKEGRANKFGFLKPRYKKEAGIKSEGKGKKKRAENGGGRDDYIERNKNVKFLPGMFISETSKRKFPQYDAQVGLHEEDDAEDHQDGEMSGVE